MRDFARCEARQRGKVHRNQAFITAYTKNTTLAKPASPVAPTTANTAASTSGLTFEQQQDEDTQMFGGQLQTAPKFLIFFIPLTHSSGP